MAKWFTETTKAHPPAELVAWNQTMLNRGLGIPGKQEYFNKHRDAVDPLPHRPHQLDKEAV